MMNCRSVTTFAVLLSVTLIGNGRTSSYEEFEVDIAVSYSPPSTFDRPAPYYRAASPLSLTCEVKGVSGEGVFYEWRSTCVGNCFATRRTTKTVKTPFLHSYDSGVHMCIVYDGQGRSGNASIDVNVVGAGIYVSAGEPPHALPNNSLIVAGVDNRISEFRCLSGSSSSGVGQLISSAGEDITFLHSDHFLVRKGRRYDPGLVHIRRVAPLTRDEQGVYTCRIPDEKGVTLDVNVALYLKDSAVPPRILDMEYAVNSAGLYTVTCTSFGSPPTSVTWTKDGATLSTENVQHVYTSTQVLVDRNETIYENVLTINGSIEDAVGEYGCTVQNYIGTSKTMNKTIKAIEITGHDSPILVGLSGSMNCSTLLDVSKMEWYIKGFNDPVESGLHVNSLVLTLNPDSTALNGRSLICQVTATSGEVYEETVVAMIEELENTIRFEGPVNPLLAGGSYSLTCIVTADLLPVVTWRDGKGNEVPREHEENEGVFTTEEEVIGHSVRVTLKFRQLLTSQGGSYTCLSVIEVPSSLKVGIRDIIVKIPTPEVRIINEPDTAQLFTSDTLDLLCLCNIDLAVDVPVQVDIDWLGPSTNVISNGSRISVVDVQGEMLEYNSILSFNSLQSSDSGIYTCTSIAVPTLASRYITNSDSGLTATTVNAVLKTRIIISYTPPDQYPEYAPPNYRAASSVTLHCTTEGASGVVRYRWSSTCNSCFVSSSTSSSISESMLKSRDRGVHTCTATDSVGNTGSDSITMNIVGAGIYVTRSISYAGRQAAQPNNTYVVVDTGSNRYTDYVRLKLYCCSNSTSSSVGSFTFPNHVTRTNNYNYFRISRFSAGDTYAGCIFMDIYYNRQREVNCYYSGWYRRRRICSTVQDDTFVLSDTQTGIYSCNIRDIRGNSQKVHFALYSEASYNYNISVQEIQQVASPLAPTLSCLTTGIPPTEVTWQKDGWDMTINDSTTEMVKSITTYYNSSYTTSLSLFHDIDSIRGSYTCTAGNRLGTRSSETLTIKGIETNLTSRAIVVGGHVKFVCSSDLDPQTITWYRNGLSVASELGSSKEITIDPVSTDDHEVTYSCIIISPYGSQERNKSLNVAVPNNWATVSTTIPWHKPLHGNNYTITCTVHIIEGMNIAPVIQWYHSNGSVIESGKRVAVSTPPSISRHLKTSSLTFSPVVSDDGGQYSCQAQVTVPWMTEQPRVNSASINMVVTTQAVFQLQFGPVSDCASWKVPQALDLQSSIKMEIESAIQDRCDCNFYSSAIHSGEFSCQTTDKEVVYRAIIKGTSDLHTAAELLDFIDDWRKNNQTILHNNLFRYRMSQDCPLRIASFNEVECKMNHKEPEQCMKCHDKTKEENMLFGSGMCYRFQACEDGDEGSGGSRSTSESDEGDEMVPAE